MRQQADPVRVTRHDDPAALGLDPVGLDALVSTLRQWHEAGDAGMQLAVYRHGILAIAVACGEDPFTGRPIRHDKPESERQRATSLARARRRSLGARLLGGSNAKGLWDGGSGTLDCWTRGRVRISRICRPRSRTLCRLYHRRRAGPPPVPSVHPAADRYRTHPGFIELRYEDLCQSPAKKMQWLFHALGNSW